MNRLVYGVGVNDADYTVQPSENKIRSICPYYLKWNNMLRRAYSTACHSRYPTYKNSSVCDEWLKFSTFKNWMASQDWQGKELDKDLIKPGNKIYTRELCCFVSPSLNLLLNNRGALRGKWPIGASFHKSSGLFQAQCQNGEGNVYLGLFNTPEEAHAAYIKFKTNLILDIASRQSDERITNGLRVHVDNLLQGLST